MTFNKATGNTTIGNLLRVGTNAVIGANLTVGANLGVGNNATIGNNLTIGTNANIGTAGYYHSRCSVRAVGSGTVIVCIIYNKLQVATGSCSSTNNIITPVVAQLKRVPPQG